MDSPNPQLKILRHDTTKVVETVYFDVNKTQVNSLLPERDRLQSDACVEIVFSDGIFQSHRFLQKSYRASDDEYSSWTPTQRFFMVVAPEIALAVSQHEVTYKVKKQLYADSINPRRSESLPTQGPTVGSGAVQSNLGDSVGRDKPVSG